MTELFKLGARVAQQGVAPRSDKVAQALSGTQPTDALNQLRGISTSLTSNGTARSGFLRLLNSSHAEQELKLEKHGRVFMAFHGNRNKETAQALMTLATNAGISDATLTAYLQSKINTGAKIRIRTLEAHLKRALQEPPQQPSRSVQAGPTGLGSPHHSVASNHLGSQPQIRPSTHSSEHEASTLLQDDQRPFVGSMGQASELEAHSLHSSIASGHHDPLIQPESDQVYDDGNGAIEQEPPPFERANPQPIDNSLANELGSDAMVDGELQPELDAEYEYQDRESMSLDPHRRLSLGRGTIVDPDPIINPEPRPSSLRLADPDGPARNSVAKSEGPRSSEVQEPAQGQLSRLQGWNDLQTFVSEGLEFLDGAQAIMGRIEGHRVLPAFQKIQQSAQAIDEYLEDLRDIEQRYDDSRGLRQELDASRKAMAPALRYFRDTLPNLGELLNELQWNLTEFAPELQNDTSVDEDCQALARGLKELMQEFSTKLDEAEFHQPSAKEIQSRQDTRIREAASALSEEVRALHPQAQKFSHSRVIGPRAKLVEQLIQRAISEPSREGTNQLIAEQSQLEESLKTARSLLKSVENTDKAHDEILQGFREQFPDSREVQARATQALSSTRAWCKENTQRLNAAIIGLERMIQQLATAENTVSLLVQQRSQERPSARVQLVIDNANKIGSAASGEQALITIEQWLVSVEAINKGVAGKPDADQRRQLQRALADDGAVAIQITDSVKENEKGVLKPLQEKLERQLEALDRDDVVWRSTDSELREKVDAAQSRLEAAKSAFRAQELEAAGLAVQIEALSKLALLEDQMWSSQDPSEQERLVGQLADGLQELAQSTSDRVIDLGGVRQALEELGRTVEDLRAELLTVTNADQDMPSPLNTEFWEKELRQARAAADQHQRLQPGEEVSATRREISRVNNEFQALERTLLARLQSLHSAMGGV